MLQICWPYKKSGLFVPLKRKEEKQEGKLKRGKFIAGLLSARRLSVLYVVRERKRKEGSLSLFMREPKEIFLP